MTWIKLPDDALDDPQVADVAPEAVVAYLRTLGWSNRWARDGLVPVSIAGEHATAWLAGGLAEQSEVGIQLAWLLEYQPEADEIAARKRDAVNRQKRHRRHMAGDHSQCDPKRCLVLLSATRDQTRDQRRDQRTLRSDPSPSLPDPKGRGEETGSTRVAAP